MVPLAIRLRNLIRPFGGSVNEAHGLFKSMDRWSWECMNTED